MKKRIFTLLLAACMAFSLLPLQALAAQPVRIPAQTQTIPIDVSDLRTGGSNPTVNYDESIWIDADEYMRLEDAAETLQLGMIRRENYIFINAYFDYTSEETLEDEILDLAVAIAAEALRHTSDSSFHNGDYLSWNLQNLEVELLDGMLDDELAYVNLRYYAEYMTTKDQEDELERAVAKAIGSTPMLEHYADGDAIRAVYDYVTENVTVLSEVTDPIQHTAYSAMVNGEASPIGVALLTYYLSYQCGVPCRVISGTVDGYTHIWNIASVNGLYYNLDASIDAVSAEEQYFMVCPANFTDHVRDEEYDTAEFHAEHPMATEDLKLCIHTYDDGEILNQPTCTERGYKIYTCTLCGKTRDEYIPTVDHTYDEGAVTQEPTCNDYGRLTYTCTMCGDSYFESIPALGHDYASVVTEGTCTTDGYTTHTCTRCGDTYTDNHIPAPGHNLETVTVEPTCTEDGSATHTCTVCGEVSVEVIPATGHTHDGGTVTREPTCTQMGLMDCVCTTCGAAFVAEIPMLDHTYEGGVCTECGDLQLLAPAIVSCYSKEQTSVKVTWTPVQNASGYELFRTATPDDDNSWTKVKTITGGDTDRYTNQGLTEGVTYYYKVRAYLVTEENTKEYSDFSDADYMPAAVVFDDPYSNATYRIRLRWNEVGGAHGYQIWRQNADGSWAIVKTLGDKGNTLTNDQGGTTAYSNTGLTAGEIYTYKMRAFMITEDGRKVFGAYSDEYQVAVLPEAPVLWGSSSRYDRAELTWTAVNGASGYQIWMEDPFGNVSIVKSVTDGSVTEYTKYDLSFASTYHFRIRAYVEVNGRKSFSEFSETVRVDTPFE